MSDLQAGLVRVDTRLHEVVAHDDAFIAAASAHLLDAGGKRFRPMLTLLASELGDGINDDVIEAAVGVELTHLASLYHDDVMDEADVRRGVPSANAAYDNATAILVGDLLFGRASEVIAGLGAEAVRIQAQTFVRLCQGQIQDERQAPAGADAMTHYLGVLADKTVDVMIQYGELIGLIFQLADDVLDITSQSQQSGKVPGTDLREGVLTLPVLYLRESTDPADARLLELTSGPIEEEEQVQEALTLLRAHPAVERARAHALQLADDAAGLLDPLPDSEAVQTLRALPYQVAGRSA